MLFKNSTIHAAQWLPEKFNGILAYKNKSVDLSFLNIGDKIKVAWYDREKEIWFINLYQRIKED